MSWPKIGANGLPYWEKAPNEILDYTLDWTPWLDGSTINTSVWVVPTGVTKTVDTKAATDTTIWLSAGVRGTRYLFTNRIVTNDTPPRTREKSFELIIQNR